MYSSFDSRGRPIQIATLPIRKYWGKTDPRTPLEFLREFDRSFFRTYVNDTDIKNFLALLGDPLSIYAPALWYSSFDDMKKYFLKLTWTNSDRQKELEAIVTKKFDPNGEETWESYLIRTYIRLQDCRPQLSSSYNSNYENIKMSEKYEENFQKIMMMKLMEVGKSNLPVHNFTEIEATPDGLKEQVRWNDLTWFAELVYSHSDSVFDNPQELKKDIVTAQVEHQPDSKIGNLPTRKSEVSENETRHVDPDTLQGHKPENIPRRCDAENSFRTAFLFSVLYFILYYLILQFWNSGYNFDTSIMDPKKN